MTMGLCELLLVLLPLLHAARTAADRAVAAASEQSRMCWDLVRFLLP